MPRTSLNVPDTLIATSWGAGISAATGWDPKPCNHQGVLRNVGTANCSPIHQFKKFYAADAMDAIRLRSAGWRHQSGACFPLRENSAIGLRHRPALALDLSQHGCASNLRDVASLFPLIFCPGYRLDTLWPPFSNPLWSCPRSNLWCTWVLCYLAVCNIVDPSGGSLPCVLTSLGIEMVINQPVERTDGPRIHAEDAGRQP
jgi:hypothetical protein